MAPDPDREPPSDQNEAEAAPFRDAEAWLAEQGIERRPLWSDPRPAGPGPGSGPSSPPPRSRGTQPPAGSTPGPHGGGPTPGRQPASPAGGQGPGGPRLEHPAPGPATAGPAPAPPPAGPTGPPVDAGTAGDGPDGPATAAGGPRMPGHLEDEVATAVAFIRRSTARTPQSEGRLRGKLADRDHRSVVVNLALEEARRQGLVDDRALGSALVQEWRGEGHALPRIRRDLARRDLPDDLIEELLAPYQQEDPEVAALALARHRAEQLHGVEPRTAFRRILGHLIRRGYPEDLARRVARRAVLDP